MVVTYAFEDSGNSIKMTRTVDVPAQVTTTKLNKRNISVTVGVTKDLLEISDLRGSGCVAYADITAPASTDIEDLCDILQGWLDDVLVSVSISPPVGAATEAKQDDGIALLTTIDADTSNLDVLLSTRATEAKQDDTITSLGTDGAAPPAIAGTGVRGWLRGIYERVANIASLTFTGGDLNVNATVTSSANTPELIFGTTANLLASVTFNSGILSLVGRSQVETRVLSDTDGTINVFFYEDAAGIDTVRTLTIPYIGGDGFQYFAAPAFSNYVQYQFINSATNQTDFLYETKVLTTALSGQIVRLDGAIVAGMVAPITRSVLTGLNKNGKYENVKSTPSGNLQVTNVDAQTGANQIVDLNGAAKLGEAIILVGDVFGNNIPNALQWDEEFVGSGAIVNEAGALRVETSTTADSEVRFQSTKKARFMLSQFNIFHCGLQLDNLADPDCDRRFGVFDPINAQQNGAYFALIGGAWNVGYCKDGVETLIPQVQWNGTNKDLFNDSTALSPYEIHYNAGSVFYFQRGNFIHRASGFPTPYASEYNFKVAVETINKNGNTNNNGIDLYALGVYRLGEERGETISRVFSVDTLIKSSAGYVSNAYLSRTGSGGNEATLIVYDGVDNAGIEMGRIDIGGDDVKGIQINSTFSEGLFIEVTGTGTKNATISYE